MWLSLQVIMYLLFYFIRFSNIQTEQPTNLKTYQHKNIFHNLIY